MYFCFENEENRKIYESYLNIANQNGFHKFCDWISMERNLDKNEFSHFYKNLASASRERLFKQWFQKIILANKQK